ncbi:M24 family metallopeptidase [Steroidobacter sp.]|uniref:M24 family metallopeptidase n=1 Tax=Steroidobacter sp. TaxID=1978227 RepID=UPI001A5FE4A3|nr:M24 family metallopeptidase [Steroidobacter sp.]MBL8267608.1 aminopeptidase P family protein [Steroidobacter sp.]
MSNPAIAEERVGPNYDRERMLEARQHTFRAIDTIAAQIRPGMTEQQGLALAKSVLKEAGLMRGWHGVYLRFGENTLCTYAEKNAPDRVLQDNDIFFIDIGPVWQRWEGDGGGTFVVGNDPDMQRCARDVHEIFDLVHAKWRTDALTGIALYNYASEVAQKLGWVLNMDVSGHRLSDFPHAAIHEGTLTAANFVPKADLWVLEIQIRHPTRPFGAFFEDLMLEAGRWPRG